MNVTSYCLGSLGNRGVNQMEPNNHTYKNLQRTLGRKPTYSDLPPYAKGLQDSFDNYNQMTDLLRNDHMELYIKLNSGARAGSIAKVTKRPAFNSHSWNNVPILEGGASMELTWDDGKVWSFKIWRNLSEVMEENHTIMVGYEGPTSYIFTKGARPVADIPTMYDAYGNEIGANSWVMDERFRVGKIVRVSSAGTMWVDFIGQKIRNSLGQDSVTKPSRSRCGSNSIFLKVDPPEEFEAFAMIMDRDVSCIDIIPTFNYTH